MFTLPPTSTTFSIPRLRSRACRSVPTNGATPCSRTDTRSSGSGPSSRTGSASGEPGPVLHRRGQDRRVRGGTRAVLAERGGAMDDSDPRGTRGAGELGEPRNEVLLGRDGSEWSAGCVVGRRLLEVADRHPFELDGEQRSGGRRD